MTRVVAASRPPTPSLSLALDERDRSSLWTVAVAGIALLLYALSPFRDRFPATLAGIACFASVTAFVPGAMIRRTKPVSPLNWFLLLFFLSLVVNPLLLCFAGPYQNTLPQLPPDSAINVAELIGVIAFLGFASGCEIHRRRTLASTRAPLATRKLAPPRPKRVALIFALLGLAGLALAFHSPSALRSYFTQASGHVGLQQQTGGGVSKVASLVLRSFLQYAIVIPWCVWLDRARPSRWRLWGSIILVGALVAVAEATFSYNRGSIAAPLVALLAVLGSRRIRLRLPVLVAIGLVAFSILAVARTYRNSSYTIAQAVTNSHARSYLIAHTNLSREVQIYANAPQYLGYFLDREDYGARPTYGLTVLSSVLSPVPRLGTPFRATSGPTLFNRQIYGPGSKEKDQIVPFQGELFLDFAYPGVFVGYVLLGMLAMSLERGFQRGQEALRAFTWQYASIWLGFLVVGSAAVASQQMIYFFWPVIVLWLLAVWRRRQNDEVIAEQPTVALPATTDD